MFDKEMSEKFLKKLDTMSNEEIFKRAEHASSCGIEAVLEEIRMTELPKEHQVGSVASNGKFYTPKYWVAKLKTDSDVLIQTAHKSLNDCQRITEDFYKDAVYKDEVVYILIEIRKPPILFE